MRPTQTSRAAAVPTAGTAQETFLDRLGIPHVLRWGFLGVLVFMTGNGIESNFISPHMANVVRRRRRDDQPRRQVITVYIPAT